MSYGVNTQVIVNPVGCLVWVSARAERFDTRPDRRSRSRIIDELTSADVSFTRICAQSWYGPGVTHLRERLGVRQHRATTDDPRSTETRARLIDAFERIVVDDGYGAVTASRIAGDAGVSRSAFYDHFAGPVDVALALVSDHFDAIAAKNRQIRAHGLVSRRENTHAALVQMATHMAVHRVIYQRLLLPPSSVAVADSLLARFVERARPAVRDARPDLDERGETLATTMLAGAVLATLTQWMREGSQPAPAVLATEIVDLLPEWLLR